MTGPRMFAVFLVFVVGVIGWGILGSASHLRSTDRSSNLSRAVQQLWGQPIVQSAPSFTVNVPGTDRERPLLPSANEIDVTIELDHRRKGLIWYSLFEVDFRGSYTISNNAGIAQRARIQFAFPSKDATYRALQFLIDGVSQDIEIDTTTGLRHLLPLAPDQSRTIEVRYRTRGLDSWRYELAAHGNRVKNLDFKLHTNFQRIDYLEASLSPMAQQQTGTGMQISWRANDLVTRQGIGVLMPEEMNPGPLSARMSFFAPVCLLFFFVLITAICILRKIDIHPMHYLFVNAGFFAFHLIFAYFVDVVDVHITFAIASAVSVILVISYLAAALGRRFPWHIAAIGQLFYLVLFSYSFFLEGMTGLTITVASVITLAVLMWMTARLDWSEVFGSKSAG
ncbi:MAG: inner membrane CreD family protein [Gammaproteobacteria bacterium]|nr:inner membrane CreD family protein [Gammaproteobacteria bacterium]